MTELLLTSGLYGNWQAVDIITNARMLDGIDGRQGRLATFYVRGWTTKYTAITTILGSTNGGRAWCQFKLVLKRTGWYKYRGHIHIFLVAVGTCTLSCKKIVLHTVFNYKI